MTLRKSLLAWVLVGVVAMALVAGVNAQTPAGCPAVSNPDAPAVTITNGVVNAVVLLPDAEKGFYKGVRFDWSGAVWCLMYKGHNFFGPWYSTNAAPMKDPITGPVEEWRSADGRSALGYEAAKPGELFVKPGVGLLKRVDEKPFAFQTAFPLVDGGKWTVKPSKSGVVFRQVLKSALGYDYDYKKTLKLDAREPVLVIVHEMKNTGTKPIDIQVYNHDFFVFDGKTPAVGLTVKFPFVPQLDRDQGKIAHIDGKTFVLDTAVEPTPGQGGPRPAGAAQGGQGQGAPGQAGPAQTPGGQVKGFSDQASDFDFVVENPKTGVGVEEIGSLPLASLQLWSNAQTVCPEAYVHVVIQPGETKTWSIRYRFMAK